MRKITYSQAIREATEQAMKKDKNVFVIGQGVTSPWYVGDTTEGLFKEFGEKRVIDTPVSEAAVTGAAVGAAIAGGRPILIHPRMDFMLLAMDQIINQASNWYYMFGGNLNVPIVIRGIINRGGEQAAQHSQALQSIFMHVPGLKVVMPSNAYDAKGLLVSAVRDENPVVYIDDRWLYQFKTNVPQKIYSVPIGKARIIKTGSDVTLCAVSFMVQNCLRAEKILRKEGIRVEIIDLRSLKPLDEETILESVKKTKRLIITDTGWKTAGISAEISARVSETKLRLKSPIKRVTLPDIPAPASCALEKIYYPNENDIVKAVKEII